MLTYLGMAAAILAVSSAFAWREAQSTSGRQASARMESSFQQVKQEMEKRMERSLAVVNLAAMSSQLTSDIVSRGSVELGSSSGNQAETEYGATATFVSDPAKFLPPDAKPPSGRSDVGLLVLNGRPYAAALSPISSSTGTIGYLLVTVDATPAVDIQGGSDSAYWLFKYEDAWRTIDGNIVSGLKDNEPAVKTRQGPEGSVRTIFHPVQGLAQNTIAQIAVEGSDSISPDSRTSPLLGLAVLTLSVGLFVAHYLTRLVTRPVEEITEATERVAAGDIAYQLPPSHGKDELALLSRSFNSMTSKYVRSQSEVEAAAEKLKQTVTAQDIEIQMLFAISRVITSILDIEKLLSQVLGLSMPLVGGTRGIAWLRSGISYSDDKEVLEEAALSPVLDTGRTPGLGGSIAADHPLLQDLKDRRWRLCVLMPGGRRNTFFASADTKDSYHKDAGEHADKLALPDQAGNEITRVIVPLYGQEDAIAGLLQIMIPGTRQISEHEAMLIDNVISLASVAVTNAGLYGLAQRRGQQVATLLREAHHRITNNLAAVGGVLSVQLSKTHNPETAQVLEDNLARISSIAQVHRLLSGEMNDEVEIVHLLKGIARSTISAGGRSADEILLKVSGAPLVIPAKMATPVAVMANELVINSLKHGFPTGWHKDGQKAQITLAVSRENDIVEIRYSDNGVGGSQSLDATKQGMGTQIINSLVSGDLEGNWNFRFNDGYQAAITFPVSSGSITKK